MSGQPSATRTLSASRREYVFNRFSLQAVRGPDAGRRVESSGEELAVGTERGNDLVLSDSSVSRHHFTICATERGLVLRDLGSTNGTMLGGYRILAALLEPRTLIGAGRTVLRVEVSAEEIRQPLSAADHFGELQGVSAPMRRVFALLEAFSRSDGTVLIEGESGTGKELAAEAIHAASPRRDHPFMVVDCGAIARQLVESELFGHERGSFTGAIRDRIGVFEAAGSGTVFLDEIGELPLDLQPRLLRVLESRTVRRLGGQASIPIDVRVVAATNRDLRAEVNAGRFRSDLFYRLNVLHVLIPPLRDRSEDIPGLIEHFCRTLGGADHMLPDLVTALCGQRWSGNARELRSAVERAVLFGDPARWTDGRDSLSPRAAAALDFDESLSFSAAKEKAIAAWERAWLTELLRRHPDSLSEAARRAAMSRTHLRVLLARRGVRRDPDSETD
jgi:DNA-binding NtrC family response regulator